MNRGVQEEKMAGAEQTIIRARSGQFGTHGYPVRDERLLPGKEVQSLLGFGGTSRA